VANLPSTQGVHRFMDPTILLDIKFVRVLD
jgi:hypothetical protein